MRKPTYILLIILICHSFQLIGQSSYAPLGAFWNYGYSSHSGSQYSTWTIEVTNDTVINGTAIKTLTLFDKVWVSWSPPPFVGTYSYPFGEIHFRNDSVFRLESGVENYLYSFDMKVGDSISIIPGSVYTAVVDSISYIILNNDTLKQWFLTKHCNTSYQESATIIENIGPVDDYLFWQVDGCLIGGGTYNFECYNSSVLNYNLPCIPITLRVDDIYGLKNKLTIFPSPVQGLLTFSLENSVEDCRVRILDLTMRIVYDHLFSTLLSSQIDISNLPEGNYWLSLESEKYRNIGKVTKIK
jgi:hypothetical protein